MEQDGTGSDVQQFRFVKTEKNGMFSSLCVNVLLIAFGMGRIVLKLYHVKTGKFQMVKTAVFVPKELIGTEIGVKTMDALEDKLGMDLSVFVNLGTTTMEVYACFVSTAKSGTQEKEPAIVQGTTFGTGTFVRRKYSVQETEFGMTQFSNVCAQTNTFGTALVVWFNQIVVAEKFGTRQPSSVTVLITSTSMVLVVSYA